MLMGSKLVIAGKRSRQHLIALNEDICLIGPQELQKEVIRTLGLFPHKTGKWLDDKTLIARKESANIDWLPHLKEGIDDQERCRDEE